MSYSFADFFLVDDSEFLIRKCKAYAIKNRHIGSLSESVITD
jgi:hypothetical protein